MLTWLQANYLQITGVIAVAIMLTVGRAALLPKTRSDPFLLWVAFAITAVCGLVLGWALYGVMAWLTALPGLFGGAIASVGAIVAVWLGWHGVYQLVALVRDVADRSPDAEARKAALWVPTFLPAGGQAVWGIVSNPQGLGTTLTAAIMAVLTILYVVRIAQAALSASAAPKLWRWFATGVCVLGGLVMIPLLAFADAQAAQFVPSELMVAARILSGVAGFALAFAALRDLRDRVPDKYARACALAGVPLLVVSGATAWGWITGTAGSGLELLTGSAL